MRSVEPFAAVRAQPGQAASHSGCSGRLVRMFWRRISSRSISWCSSISGCSSSCRGTLERQTGANVGAGQELFVEHAVDSASALVQAARALEDDARDVLAVDQDALRACGSSARGRVTGPRRCSSSSGSGSGSEKSNSRTVPRPDEQQLGHVDGHHRRTHKKAARRRAQASQSIGPSSHGQQNASAQTGWRLVAVWRASSSVRPRSTVWATWPIWSRSFCSTR